MKKITTVILTVAFCLGLTACAWCAPSKAKVVSNGPISEKPLEDLQIPPVESPKGKVDAVGESLDYPVASVKIIRPQVTLENASAQELINNYYLLLTAKVKDYVEGDLIPDPYSDEHFTVTAEFTVSYFDDTRLSIIWEVTTASSLESPFHSSFSSATFDTATGNLLTFDAIFGKNASMAQEKFLQKARAEISAKTEENYYYDTWWDLAESVMNVDAFYLTQEGVTLYYPRDALGTFTEVTLSWESLQGLLA